MRKSFIDASVNRCWIFLITASILLGADGAEAQGSAIIAPGDLLERKDERPLESVAGLSTLYTSVEVEPGVRLRALITTPTAKTGKLHPLIFLQWVSCGSVEFGDRGDGVLARVARDSGLALMRVDRAGAGDSQGPSCDALDYNTELAHYVAAYKKLLDHPSIDASKVYVYGSSLGSTTAPLIAQVLQSAGFNIAGIAVQGGGGLTHFERMLNFDRLYLERRPDAVPTETIDAEMRRRARFHVEYLIKGRAPDDVAKDSPDMAAVRADIRGLGDQDQYGRPFSWHQQAAQQNFLAAWSRLEAETLVIYNEYDQFEMEYGHKVIVETVNRLRPGTASFIFQEGLGHSSRRYPSALAAYANENGAPAAAETARVLINWFQKIQD